MSLQSIARVMAVLFLVEAAISIRRHGWGSYGWPVKVCLAGCLLLAEPSREGETTLARLRRPRQAAILVLAVVGMVLIVV
jgi:hypothetical protein